MTTPIAPFLAQIDLLTPLTSSGVLVGDVLLVALTAVQVVGVTTLAVGAWRLQRRPTPRRAVKRRRARARMA